MSDDTQNHEDDEEEIILSELETDELVEQMHDDLYNGLKEEIIEGTNILLERGWGPDKVLADALVEGMRIVGIDFRDGILFVPEVLMAANAMKGGMAILRPLLAETGAETVGKMVIGTVKGDIHDIGKNLVSMMMEGAGFEVIDIGINNPVENYLEAIEEHKPSARRSVPTRTAGMQPSLSRPPKPWSQRNAPRAEAAPRAVVGTLSDANRPQRRRRYNRTRNQEYADHRLRSAGARDHGTSTPRQLDPHRGAVSACRAAQPT